MKLRFSYLSFLVFFFVIILTYDAQAQKTEYKKFELDLLQFGYSPNNGKSAFFGTELRYNLSNKWSAGFAAQYYIADRDCCELINFDTSEFYTLTVDYYLNVKKHFRPFVGLQTGLTAAESFALAARIGLETWHSRLFISYHLDNSRGPDFIGVVLGITLWGGAQK